QTTFRDPDAARLLSELDIGKPVAGGELTSLDARIVRASWRQEDPTGEPAGRQEAETGPLSEDDQPQLVPDDTDDPDGSIIMSPPPEDAPEEVPWNGGPVEARSLHAVTVLLVDKGGWKKEWRPELMAWLAGVTELVGGALMLLGLFSRVWGLGLAVAMGFAYYLTSSPAPLEPNLFEVARTDNLAQFNRLYTQAGLLVLALGVMMTGPGPVSLDRLFFGRRSEFEGTDESS
ncbi:MAG: DoxX family protein, partial [Planctomycetota bacterium]